LAYIEFWHKESVQKACALNGCELGGYAISISVTQSETGNSDLPDIPMRLYIGNLHPGVSEEDLRQIFEAFGPVTEVKMSKTEDGNGYAYITYQKETDAKQALAALNGFEIAGQAITVGVVDVAQSNLGADTNAPLELDETGGGLSMTAQGRQALMAKLGRGTMMGMQASVPVPVGGVPAASGIMAAQSLSVPMIQPTTCVVIKNMFNPATETDVDWHLDIQEDIAEEIAKYGCKFVHIHVDQKHPGGHVFMRFPDVESSKKTAQSFHGRWFASPKSPASLSPKPHTFSDFPKSNEFEA